MASPEGLGNLNAEPASSAAPIVEVPKPMAYPCFIYPTCAEHHEDDPRDPAYDLNRPCHGWPALVKVMAEKPDFETFQAFKDLNIKSLLYYQAELVQLRKELHELEWEDHRKGGDSVRLSSNIRSLLSTEKLAAKDQLQLRKMKEIREVLKEYNAALLQYSRVNELPEAETFNVKTLRTGIQAHIEDALRITGPGKDSWGTLSESKVPLPSLWIQFGRLLRSIFLKEKPDQGQVDLDLVAPGRRRDIDPLTRWIAGHWVPFWHSLKKKLRGTRIYGTTVPFILALVMIVRCKEPNIENVLGVPMFTTTSNYFKASVLTRFKIWLQIQREVLDWQRGEAELKPLSTYSASSSITFMNRIPVFLATIAACLLPILGITILSRLQTQNQVLGYIAIFTFIFAFGILVLCDSSTSRSDIFTATAAFAAVLVVFVHNQDIGSTG